jgi:hypothetical protein
LTYVKSARASPMQRRIVRGLDTGRIKRRWHAALGLHSGDKGGCGFSAFLPIATALAFHGQGLSRYRSHDHLIDLIAVRTPRSTIASTKAVTTLR